MSKGISIIVCATFIASISQILLKQSANRKTDSHIKEYLNAKVVTAYLLLFVTTFLTVAAYKYIPISVAAPMDSLGQVFVPTLSFFILHEKISKKKMVGIGLIILGVVVAVL